MFPATHLNSPTETEIDHKHLTKMMSLF